MTDQLEPKLPCAITPAERKRFAKGQAKKAQMQIVTKDNAHVINHVSMMAFVAKEYERGNTSFTIKEITDGLNTKWPERGQVKTLLQELRYMGVQSRDGDSYKFLKRQWPVPAWSRFRLTDVVLTSRKARAAISSNDRGHREEHDHNALHMPAFVTRTDPRVLLVLAILSGIITLAIWVSSPPRVIVDYVTNNIFIAVVVIVPTLVFCIDAPLLVVRLLHLHYLSWIGSKHKARSRMLDDRETIKAAPLLAASTSDGEMDESEEEEEIVPVDEVRVPMPSSVRTSSIYGETTVMGNPIPILAGKLGAARESIGAGEAAVIDGAIFCSLVFKLHEAKAEDEATRLAAFIIPAGSIPDHHAIAELSARGTSLSRTLAKIDAQMEATGVNNRPSPASSMRICADPSLLNYETLLVRAPTVDAWWYVIPVDRLRGVPVEIHRVTSAIYKEPEPRTRVDTRFVGSIPVDKGEIRGYDEDKGAEGWHERDVRGNIATALFEEYAREREAGVKPSVAKRDPKKINVTLSGFPTKLTNAAISALLKRGIKVTLRCSACGSGPPAVESLGILDDESSREMTRAFKTPVIALCPACMEKHGVRVVEDMLTRHPDGVYWFLRDNDGLGARPWAFDELSAKLGALSDRAKRRLSEHLAALEKELKVRPVGESKYAFNRSGYEVIYKAPAMPPPCSACGKENEDAGPRRDRIRIHLRDDTPKVLEHVMGKYISKIVCEDCAARSGVVIFGYERVTAYD